MDNVIQRDISEFVRDFDQAALLRGSTFLVTGATGLIGSMLIRCLCALDGSIRIYAPVRNLEKGKRLFGDCPQVTLVQADLATFDYTTFGTVDYIVHGAAPTASKFFVDRPVETINTIVADTNRLLQYAATITVKGMAFLSSLEVYGQMLQPVPVTEDMQGTVGITDLRSSYPMAKRLAENLCCAYASEYGVPVRTVRLTQTTGPGIDKADNRYIAQFVRCAAEGKDIVLRTKGLSAKPCCYTIDAISAILYILLFGQNGKAYNVANEETYISVRDLAYMIKETLNPDINVRTEINDAMGYPPDTYLRLCTRELQNLGWKPRYTLRDTISRLFDYMK